MRTPARVMPLRLPRGARRPQRDNLLNYIDRYLGRGAAAISTGLGLSDSQAGLADDHVHLTLRRWSARWRAGSAIAARASLAAAGVLDLERGHLRVGAGPHLCLLCRARRDRRRRGQLRGRDAVAAGRFLSGRAARARPVDLLRGDPARLGAGLHPGRLLGAHIGWRRGLLRRRRARARCWRSRCSSCAIRRAARSTRRAGDDGDRRSPVARRRCAALARRAGATSTTPRRRRSTRSRSAGSAGWMPTYFVRERHLPLEERRPHVRRHPVAGGLRRAR